MSTWVEEANRLTREWRLWRRRLRQRIKGTNPAVETVARAFWPTLYKPMRALRVR